MCPQQVQARSHAVAGFEQADGITIGRAAKLRQHLALAIQRSVRLPGQQHRTDRNGNSSSNQDREQAPIHHPVVKALIRISNYVY